MSKAKSNTAPRERILATASELFYGQGYRATGINEVIDKSGVAKATFYHHFATKDALCQAYLEERNHLEVGAIEDFVKTKRSPRARFLAVLESLGPWLEENDLRGCGFLNMVAEEPDPGSPLRREGRRHYEALRDLIRELARTLIDSDRARYGHLNVNTVTDDYMVILGGTIAITEIYHDHWPVKQGIAMVKRLID